MRVIFLPRPFFFRDCRNFSSLPPSFLKQPYLGLEIFFPPFVTSTKNLSFLSPLHAHCNSFPSLAVRGRFSLLSAPYLNVRVLLPLEKNSASICVIRCITPRKPTFLRRPVSFARHARITFPGFSFCTDYAQESYLLLLPEGNGY